MRGKSVWLRSNRNSPHLDFDSFETKINGFSSRARWDTKRECAAPCTAASCASCNNSPSSRARGRHCPDAKQSLRLRYPWNARRFLKHKVSRFALSRVWTFGTAAREHKLALGRGCSRIVRETSRRARKLYKLFIYAFPFRWIFRR